MRDSTAVLTSVIPGATAKASLAVVTTLEHMMVSHHPMRSFLVRVFSVGRPVGVVPGVRVGSESLFCWRMTIDSVDSETPSAHPAAGLSENAAQTVASSLAQSAVHH